MAQAAKAPCHCGLTQLPSGWHVMLPALGLHVINLWISHMKEGLDQKDAQPCSTLDY